MLHIPNNLKEDYEQGRKTSAQVAQLLKVHPVTIRRQLRRNPIKAPTASKADLFRTRNLFRQSKAHLPAKELTTLLNVSYSTANRIRAKYAKQSNTPPKPTQLRPA